MIKMQAENNKNNIKTLSMGCRLNALESEKIQNMLSKIVPAAILVNTCAVTAEAERQSGQTVRRLARENPNVPIFVTGCAATRNSGLFSEIPNTMVIPNSDKLTPTAYIDAINSAPCNFTTDKIIISAKCDTPLSKQFIQVQNGCNHACTYCITRMLRGRAVSFKYDDILSDARNAVENGFYEIVLTGVDTASYIHNDFFISDLCKNLLKDVPEIQRLRISSLDPASPEIFKLIDLIHSDKRMMPHIHLSMQSGTDEILRAMGRRHNADTVRRIISAADDITFSWDIICGFPGETDDLFNQTLDLIHETKPIKIHAFPFSPRPGTPAADMSGQIDHNISKQRVKIIADAADENRRAFMQKNLGQVTQVLVEENNIARTPHDISVRIDGATIPSRTICNIKLTDIENDEFIGKTL
ncbi:MAG: MiaB/RimO family radical SAM methylthiotransferase [Alphaproteobacteria bacterium]|nr:MiaB/RimO family radical SAM methylthiotransferase [Alphaproteobacteria bacterium]